MITFEGLEENFKFIVLDVEAQASTTRQFLMEPERSLYEKIVSRDDYIDNLKTIIENKCFTTINSDKTLDQDQLNKIRAVQIITVNLERIADFLVNVVRQMGFLEDQAFIHKFDWQVTFDIIEQCLAQILPAIERGDMAKALSICKSEYDIDRLYKEAFDAIMKELSTGRQAQNLVTVLFIFRYFERIGDSLLNVGEAIIFSIIGERIKIEQFDALKRTLMMSGFGDSLAGIDFKGIWGTRSGCRIGKVERHLPKSAAKDRQSSIYKEGALEKIVKERENIARWQSLFPGLVSEIFGYNEDEAEGKGSILVEFLSGCTLDEVVLSAAEDVLGNALFVLEQTVRHTWGSTMVAAPVKTDYIGQLRSRSESVRQVHPQFWRPGLTLGSAAARSSEQLLTQCQALETTLPAPFSVFTHGDFNINNIVYNHETQQVHYIDLYRSRDYDYLQDVSTFLVSNFRTPVFDGVRERIDKVIGQFYLFAATFAAEHGDATFEARLAFALARSFYTSTRFELHYKFAREMYHRSMYLLETIAAHGGGNWEAFVLPKDILYL
ncbi:MAG: phosphotransferase [Desulfovibrionaceae bacterium]|nr:phosphotransferase [Desulfovibrionaceae bacterium]MBF0513756.1 phosphotransferase [Desulfovibrionaceae bacterium]